MAATFSWYPTARYSAQADPQEVGEELERIRSRDGKITVDAMLDSARSPVSPLHQFCEWDDAIAGENYRKDQLRKVARSLCITHLDRDPHRAFVHCGNPASGEQGYYQRTEVAVRNVDEYELVFRSARMRLNEAQRAIAELLRVADVTATVLTPQRKAVAKADKALTKAGDELAKAA